jgi:hypothetical protein
LQWDRTAVAREMLERPAGTQHAPASRGEQEA